jgi:hypothetical protein
MDWKLRGHFVCNGRCRAMCNGRCWEELEKLDNGTLKMTDVDYQGTPYSELYPRKQLIGCLGKYCDEPCEYQTEESDLTIEHLIRLAQFMGTKLSEPEK